MIKNEMQVHVSGDPSDVDEAIEVLCAAHGDTIAAVGKPIPDDNINDLVQRCVVFIPAKEGVAAESTTPCQQAQPIKYEMQVDVIGDPPDVDEVANSLRTAYGDAVAVVRRDIPEDIVDGYVKRRMILVPTERDAIKQKV